MEEQHPPQADEPVWTDIRQRYEAGHEPVKEIAASAGLSSIRLSMRAKAWGWVLRNRNKTATKSETTQTTLKRLKDLLQGRIKKLETEIDEINQEVSALSNERGIRAMNTLVRTLEKVLELERKDRIRKRKSTLALRRFDDAERGALADKIERLQRQWRGSETVDVPGQAGSDGIE